MTQAKPMILLVDDDADFVAINRHVLEAGGYRVMACYDSQEALAMLAGQVPDLIITDLVMKSLDAGFEFSRQIKSDPRLAGVPVIIATSVSSTMGYDFRPQRQQDLAAMGVDAYFDKPIEPKALLSKVRDLLAQANRERPA